MTDKNGFDPATGAWNDSLTGDFLWSRNNFGEARPDVMSPFTYSLSEKVWSEISPLPGYRLSGNICGRYYANVSFSISMLMTLGKSREAAIEQMRDLLGNVPENLEIPTVPLSRWTMLRAPPGVRVDNQGMVRGWTPVASQVGQTFSFEVRVENPDGSDRISWQVQVAPPPEDRIASFPFADGSEGWALETWKSGPYDPGFLAWEPSGGNHGGCLLST